MVRLFIMHPRPACIIITVLKNFPLKLTQSLWNFEDIETAEQSILKYLQMMETQKSSKQLQLGKSFTLKYL